MFLDPCVPESRPHKKLAFLHFELRVTPPELSVHADRRALSQILLNLTSNAVKFTETGSITLRVETRRREDRTFTEFIVAATGIGIREDDQTRLFQAFMQVDSTRSQRREGTGLGLHRSRKPAELLGGQIRLRSVHGQGSTFTLLLDGAKA